MKNSLMALGIAGLLVSSAAWARSSNYTLECDDNDIFETPLMIHVRGESASASGSFDGPGSAIFDIHYSELAVIDDAVAGTLTITRPHVAMHPNGFQLTLREDRPGRYEGDLDVTSTDGEQMPYSGHVSCLTRR